MSYSHLSSEERYVISHLVLYGLSLREIARRVRIGLLTPKGGDGYIKRIRKLCRTSLPWDKKRWIKYLKKLNNLNLLR